MYKAATNRLLQAALFFGQLCLSIHAISFPPPIGHYNTSIVTAELVDHSRLDPYASTPQPRSLMISLFKPVSPSACSPYQAPYMDPITAAFEDAEYAGFGVLPGSVEALSMEICQRNTRLDLSPGHFVKVPTYPLILFSPGMGNTRLFYSAMAQQLASTGYIVVTVDHPYDADIVTFPDNSTILAANITTDDQIVEDLYVRVQDISFVLDQLSLPSTILRLLPELAGRIDVSKVGIFGHSLGGATAAQAMLSDRRFIGGINLDGMLFGSVIERGLDRPFVIFAHEGHNLTTDATWAAFWPNLSGFRRELILNGSTHGTFTDLPEVADLIGLRAEFPQQVTELLGSTLGERASQIIATYVSSFFGFVLKGKKSELYDGPSKDFPEVAIGAF
ncbi:hypothetical protein OIDMADRAFT_38650 [Oidiodendron maius Zn]|uniref:1-alkyl-2-acetylglycerophosphocholine esterase n=1 Tax=Oidiodendron maius (strain Zn) TaxID=913774 RepID=A0A0C3DW71_OIDMZ|nr:hypothetical protein OIDMADRAFT_38650 [Oidiodendron maius Zn]